MHGRKDCLLRCKRHTNKHENDGNDDERPSRLNEERNRWRRLGIIIIIISPQPVIRIDDKVRWPRAVIEEIASER